MATQIAWRTAWIYSAILATVACVARPHAGAQTPADTTTDAAPATIAGAWTLQEALAHLRQFPQDAYVQYVALQLARREGSVAETAATMASLNPRRNQFAARRDQVDLFSIFSGTLAVQESLQLDAMTVDAANSASPVDVPAGRTGPASLDSDSPSPGVDPVPISTLEGPTIKSHPWTEMLAGRSPQVTGLALSVPSDFYFVSFHSVNKLIEAADLTNLWGAHLLSQSNHDAQTQLVNQRLRTQLAIEVTPALQPFYDTVVDEVAIVGSDLFLREGSDVTLLFHAKQPAVLRVQMDQFLGRVDAGRGDVVRTSGKYLGVDYQHVGTPDRRIYVYSAYPTPELHVRSNSLAALKRILEAIAERDARGADGAGGYAVQRLGETEEFRYVRTLLPPGDAEEDGLIYLSDPFVRRLMGPQLRLTEQRRIVCYNHLRMISHAALMYRTQTGRKARTLADLAQADCVPGAFGQGQLACSDHGEYSLAADGVTGVCTVHGYAHSLTPCIEIETTHVTAMEAEAYRMFLEQYNSYWRQFFDPIAMRLQITPRRYRLETIILPLIDNSIYTGLARALGGPVEPLDALPVPRRNIFSVALRLNKEQMLRDAGLEGLLEAPPQEVLAQQESTRRATNSLRQLAMGMLNYHDARGKFPAAVFRDGAGRPLLSWRVHMLPYIEQQGLYAKFHLDEPWDSEHNRALIAEMPPIFAGDDAALTAAGKTRFLTPRGESTAFPAGEGVPLSSLSDGTSNTVMVVEADDLHAVPWTKPDDIELDPKQPYRGLQPRAARSVLLGMCDGHIEYLRPESGAEVLACMLTRNAEDEIPWDQVQHEELPDAYRGGLFGEVPDAIIRQLRLGELLTKGIGNQIGFHAYDCEPMFDLSMSQLLGSMIGTFRGSGLNDDFLFIAPLVGSLNGPVYLSIPVKDRAIVDGFLDRLDQVLVDAATNDEFGGFFSLEQEFYHLPAAGDRSVRSYTLRLGPVKWRFFWSRIGDGMYIASKREVLDDLAKLDAAGATDAKSAATLGQSKDDITVGHGLIRMRPEHWDRVLATYRLGWEENNRSACLRNTGPLASLSRALAAGRPGGAAEITTEELLAYTARVYDVHPFCPDGGKYDVFPEGPIVTCTEHGSIFEPRQGIAPAGAAELGGLLQTLRDVTVTLTFLEDGLHAIATIERATEE